MECGGVRVIKCYSVECVGVCELLKCWELGTY